VGSALPGGLQTTPFPDVNDMGHGTALTIPGYGTPPNSGLKYTYTVNNASIPPCGAFFKLDMTNVNNTSGKPTLGVSAQGNNATSAFNSGYNPGGYGASSMGTTGTISGGGNSVLQITGSTVIGSYTGTRTAANFITVTTRATITISGGIGSGWAYNAGNSTYQFQVTGTFTVTVLYEANSPFTGYIAGNNTEQTGCPYLSCNAVTPLSSTNYYPKGYLFNSLHCLNNVSHQA